MSQGRKGRTEDEILRDRARIADLYLRGRKQWEIGQELGLSQQMVSYELGIIRKQWMESAVRDFDEAKGRELDRIDHLEREAWDAWERSKRHRLVSVSGIEEKSTGSGVDDRPAAPTETRTREETRKTDQVGDPRFLEKVAWCIDQRCKILGLHAALRLKHSGDEDGPPIRVVDELDWSKASTEELKYMKELRQRLAQRNGEGSVTHQPSERN